jgi:hypothetical protein
VVSDRDEKVLGIGICRFCIEHPAKISDHVTKVNRTISLMTAPFWKVGSTVPHQHIHS